MIHSPHVQFKDVFTAIVEDALDEALVERTFDTILNGVWTPIQIGAFLAALRVRGETPAVIAAAARAMRANMVPVEHTFPKLLDTCGTGGSSARRIAAFNVSTITGLVVAGAGAPVCKHGGRAASATSSSGDLLDRLGVAIDLGPEGVRRCVVEAGMGFCFAPRFHPAMRHAAPARKDLGVSTVFNLMGPLTNPAGVRRQVLGVSNPDMAGSVLGVLRAKGAERALVVYGHDGLDELTITTTSTVHQLEGDQVRAFTVDPADFGITSPGGPVEGGDADANAGLVHRVLGGERGPHRDIVLLNAGDGTFAPAASYPTGPGTFPKHVEVGDITGDGVLDLVSANQDSLDGTDVTVFAGLGDGTFAPGVAYPACGRPHQTAVGDVDLDGDEDVVVACWGGGVVSVLRNDGTGALGAPEDVPAAWAPHSLVLRDFDGDGDLDLATAALGDNRIAVSLNAGDGTYGAPALLWSGLGPHNLVADDLNGDGAWDLVVTAQDDDVIGVLVGNGDGTFADAVFIAVGSVPKATSIGDVDGDGLADLASGENLDDDEGDEECAGQRNRREQGNPGLGKIDLREVGHVQLAVPEGHLPAGRTRARQRMHPARREFSLRQNIQYRLADQPGRTDDGHVVSLTHSVIDILGLQPILMFNCRIMQHAAGGNENESTF